MEIFPRINASAGISYGSPLFSGSGFEFNDKGLVISSNIGINLTLSAGIPYIMKNIKLAHQSNILKYEDARNLLSIQITKNFYSLIAEQNGLLLLEEIFNLAQRQYARSEIMFRNGLVGELSLTQSGLAVENARYNLTAAQISYNNNFNEFLALLGILNNNITLSGKIEIIKIEADSDALINEYIKLRPDIIRANQEIERLIAIHTQTIMQNRAPSLDFQLGWRISDYDPYADNLSGSATLTIPIDPWIPGTPRNQTSMRASESVEKAKIDLQMTENSAKTQIRSLCAMLSNSWESIRIARLSLDAAARNYQLTEQAFHRGSVEALTLQDSRNNLASSRQRLLQTEVSYFNMILDLSAALNVDWKYLIKTYGVSSE